MGLEEMKAEMNNPSESFVMGQPVRHLKRILHEATYQGVTPKGRVMVRHNYRAPWGVGFVIDYFKAESIVIVPVKK
jgi:hypothetical protein